MANIFSRIWGVIKRAVLPRPGRDISKKPTSQLRKASTAELAAMGASPKSERYVLKGQKRIGPKTPFLTKRQYRTRRTQEVYGEALPPEKAAKRRGEGSLGYSDERRQRQAARVRDTARKRRAYGGEKAAVIKRFKELQRRKRAGELLPDDDFDFMMDFAKRHTNLEHDFLHEDFINSPPKRRKKQTGRTKPRMSARTRMRAHAAGQPLPRRESGR
jgi:hypothetical protein